METAARKRSERPFFRVPVVSLTRVILGFLGYLVPYIRR